jgi:hypothetical protein
MFRRRSFPVALSQLERLRARLAPQQVRPTPQAVVVAVAAATTVARPTQVALADSRPAAAVAAVRLVSFLAAARVAQALRARLSSSPTSDDLHQPDYESVLYRQLDAEWNWLGGVQQ